ncbi:hypothetical protein HDU83_005027 [Entophlyctis luteolus]|nr:hypothetical protein HDU83_005027 [Entophlyctis luteolus]
MSGNKTNTAPRRTTLGARPDGLDSAATPQQGSESFASGSPDGGAAVHEWISPRFLDELSHRYVLPPPVLSASLVSPSSHSNEGRAEMGVPITASTHMPPLDMQAGLDRDRDPRSQERDSAAVCASHGVRTSSRQASPPFSWSVGGASEDEIAVLEEQARQIARISRVHQQSEVELIFQEMGLEFDRIREQQQQQETRPQNDDAMDTELSTL